MHGDYATRVRNAARRKDPARKREYDAMPFGNRSKVTGIARVRGGNFLVAGFGVVSEGPAPRTGTTCSPPGRPSWLADPPA